MAQYYQIFNLSKTSNTKRITICHFCGLSSGIFTTGKQFNEHLLKHKKLQFNCNQCAKILPTPKSLRDHQRDVHGEGFTCKCCNNQFSKKSNLNRHLQSTPKECDVCKISVSASNLKRHPEYKQIVKNFEAAWFEIYIEHDVWFTNKCHVIIDHVPQAIERTGRGLLGNSEQVVEASHAIFDRFWKKYLVVDLESDIHGERLLQCVIDFNSSNI